MIATLAQPKGMACAIGQLYAGREPTSWTASLASLGNANGAVSVPATLRRPSVRNQPDVDVFGKRRMVLEVLHSGLGMVGLKPASRLAAQNTLACTQRRTTSHSRVDESVKFPRGPDNLEVGAFNFLA